MIYDANDNLLLYWPINGLVEGQDSQHITVRIDTPVAQSVLTTNEHPNLRVMGRVGSSGPFVDLASVGIDLSSLPTGRTSFEVYAKAVGPISGLARIVLAVGSTRSSSAAYMA